MLNIPLPQAMPIKLPPRRLSVKKERKKDNEIDKMLDDDIIEPSSGPWASPILFLKKKDRSICFYRKINVVVKKNAYPLPRTDECLELLSGSKFKCTLDLASGYWQQEVDIKDRENTAFASHRGLFQMKVTPLKIHYFKTDLCQKTWKRSC